MRNAFMILALGCLAGCVTHRAAAPVSDGRIEKGRYAIVSSEMGTNRASLVIQDCNRIDLRTVSYESATAVDVSVDWPYGNAYVSVIDSNGTSIADLWVRTDGTNVIMGVRQGDEKQPEYIVQPDGEGRLTLKKMEN